MSEVINMTPEKTEELRKAYQNCTGNTFVFEGRVFLKDYAKYFLEHLDNEFKRKNN